MKVNIINNFECCSCLELLYLLINEEHMLKQGLFKSIIYCCKAISPFKPRFELTINIAHIELNETPNSWDVAACSLFSTSPCISHDLLALNFLFIVVL